jgi:hypothetical protein
MHDFPVSDMDCSLITDLATRHFNNEELTDML